MKVTIIDISLKLIEGGFVTIPVLYKAFSEHASCFFCIKYAYRLPNAKQLTGYRLPVYSI